MINHFSCPQVSCRFIWYNWINKYINKSNYWFYNRLPQGQIDKLTDRYIDLKIDSKIDQLISVERIEK